MSKLTKRQHYVPQFYLRNFANDNHMFYTFDKQYLSIKHTGVRGSANADWFYEPIGTPTNKIENILSKIETFFASALTNIIEQCDKNGAYVLNEDESTTILLFWVIQLTRTPLSKETFGDIFAKHYDDSVKQNVYCMKFWDLILRMYGNISKDFVIKDVEILCTADEFWVSDCPCVVTKIKETEISDTQQLWVELPLCYKYYARIIMSKRTSILERKAPMSVSGKVGEISNEETREINQRLINSSIRYIYKKSEFTAQEKSVLGVKKG